MHIMYNAANICGRLPYEGVLPRLMIAALTVLILSGYIIDNGDVPLTNVHMCTAKIIWKKSLVHTLALHIILYR